ncbi:MAG: efflux RND transporter permease subunit [Saprospiraceae bacterium]
MNISELSLRRPVLAMVMSIVLVLFGYVGYKFLSLREFPAIDPPVVTIRTNYTGANAEIVESQITEPLEKAINGVPGIRSISSQSISGSSTITVEFELGIDMDAAASDVRDKVNQGQRNLPQDIDAPPTTQKSDANSDPIIILGVQSKNRSMLELSDYAANVLVERFQTIPEVSGVNIFGERKYSMRLWIKPDKLNVYNLTMKDIQQALNKENIELPAGKVAGSNTELNIKTMGRLSTEEDFRKLILREDSNGMVRLENVADVTLGPEFEENSFRLNGSVNCALAIVPQPGSNYIKIADEFYKRLEELKKNSAEDLELTVVIDVTKNVRRSLSEVKETLIISFGLVVLVILFFFRSVLIAIRPLIDIPVSLIAAFFIMYVMGFSINVLTLLAIVLATGLVVDDGIVVTENIFRKLEQGLPIRQAALEGSKEIFFAVISTSLTLAVVFLPVIFLQGFVGSLFKEFGIVVAGAVLISAFVSLTLTPVLNVLMQSKKTGHGWLYEKTEPFFKGMENGYRNLLAGFLKVRQVAFAIILICFWMIYYFVGTLQTELAPLEDRSSIRFSFTAPEGTSFDRMDKYVDKVTLFLRDSIPETLSVFGSANNPFFGTGANSGFGRIILVDPAERKRSQMDVANYLNKRLGAFNEGRIFCIQEQTISAGGIGGRGGLPVQYVIQNQDFNKIKEVLPKFLQEARQNPVFQQVDVNLKFNKPELEVKIDRIKARDLGVNVADISEAMQASLSGRRAGYFLMNGKQYQIIAQVSRDNRDDPSDFNRIYVNNSRNELIPLSSLIEVNESSSPPSLYHYNRYKSATISASLATGKTIGDGVEQMKAIGNRMLDSSFSNSLTGPSRDFAESNSSTIFAFLLALLLIYLVLAAQFESFIDPLTIMITVPLALAGALLSLYLTDGTINIFSQIGMIMLVGLVTKNGILIVEFANKKREAGEGKWEATLNASAQRLRPILMTTLATALGALPIALSLGAAATSRIPLGVVIVGGLSFSLALTLFVIPAIYTFFSRDRKVSPE